MNTKIAEKMDELIEWAHEITTESEYEDFEQAEQELYMMIEREPNADELYDLWCERINEVVWNIPTGVNALIFEVNAHNDKCAESGRTEELLNEAVELCCNMRANGFPAVVDTLTAEVVDGTNLTTGTRYLTFEWSNGEGADDED